MADAERRIAQREPMPIGVYLVVDGVRHPGTLRDLSITGAGFSDPVLAVRLNLNSSQKVVLEIPPESPGPEPLRLPGEVAHVSSGLRPRLGIRFEPLDPQMTERLNRRLGREMPVAAYNADGALSARKSADPDTWARRGGSVDPDARGSTASWDPDASRTGAEKAEFRYVLIEPTKSESNSTTIIFAAVIGVIVVAAFFGLLVLLSQVQL